MEVKVTVPNQWNEIPYKEVTGQEIIGVSQKRYARMIINKNFI